MLGGDLINLKIKPEVSSLDFNNAIVLEGFRIPALTSRRAETEVELRDGQTFAIAGLLNNTALSSMRKIPGLGDIPILGYLFKSKAYTKDQTELVVMVTPTIVRRDSTGVSPVCRRWSSRTSDRTRSRSSRRRRMSDRRISQSKPGGRGGDDAPQAQPMPETVATTPIQAAAPLPVVDEKTKAQKKAAEAAEKQRVADEKQQAEAAKRQAEADKDAAKKAEKLEKERAKQQAEADKKAEEARKKSSGKTDQTKQTGGQ